jgi:hypothetical protein
MSTVKITELPEITTINANTANTIFVGVDIPTDVTGKFTYATLTDGIYSDINTRITANAASANSVINTRISANAASANSVINTNISANVATLRGEITANAVSANSVINTNTTTLRGEITANAASANSVINTRISANVATLLANTNGVYTAGDFYISGDGFVNGNFYPQKGFIYTPLTYPGAQTAIVVDFANNSLVRANCSADISVTHTNYIPGKVVELWITNTSGLSRTFVHGCSSTNSTVNSISYAIPSTSTIFVRYTSFYNDLGNTFVAIIHA